jgi:hypothetical protein
MGEERARELQEQCEHRAPGWVIRCLRCGLTEPWGKYGVRMHAWSYKQYTIGRCHRCRRICCHAIEKRPGKPREG